MCGCCRGASTLFDGGFGIGCEKLHVSSVLTIGFEKVAGVDLSYRYLTEIPQ